MTEPTSSDCLVLHKGCSNLEFFVEGIVGLEVCARVISRMITLTQTAPGFYHLDHPFGLVPAEAIGLRVGLLDGRSFAGTIGARFFGSLSFAS